MNAPEPAAPPDPALKYRPDIDGLRAIAVLSVVLFHLTPAVSGGFVGVDVFFTISGYLIGAILLRQTGDGSFRYAEFYERRIRRIFPALFAMLLVSSVVGWRYLLPTELIAYAKTLVAAVFSASNFYFWRYTNYFDNSAASNPLLHTWSLAVEEQFYLLLPPLLVLLRRFAPRRLALVLWLLTAASFAYSAYGAFHDPAATFYLLPARIWELLLGTLLALPRGFPALEHVASRPAVRNAAGALGLVLILGCVWGYDTDIPFPGLAALPPCLGAALLIWAGERGRYFIGRLLSFKPLVWIGVISYSLYLWHRPLIVYYSFGLTWMDGLSRQESEVLLFVISLLLATLSWRFVERPFRLGAMRGSRTGSPARKLLSRGTVFALAAFAVAAAVSVSVVVYACRGFEKRFPASAVAVASYMAHDPQDHDHHFRVDECFLDSEPEPGKPILAPKCLAEVPGEKKILLIGDSHAAALWPGLNHELKGVNVMQATASGCTPTVSAHPRATQECRAMTGFIFGHYLPSHAVDAVLLAAHWQSDDMDRLSETIVWLRQRQIHAILLGPIVQYDSPLPRLLAVSIGKGDPEYPGTHRARYVEPLDRRMAQLARDVWRVPYISMYDLLCVDERCTEYAAPGIPLQYDYGHLTSAGSILVADRIRALGLLP